MFLVPVNRRAADFSRNLERLFDDGLSGLFGESREAASAPRSPALDVSESTHSYTVRVDMPGVSKDAVKITIDGRQVSVDAEQAQETQQEEGERVLYRERLAPRFSRRFSLPEEISQSDSNAKMNDGVLTLVLAKRQAKEATRLSVS